MTIWIFCRFGLKCLFTPPKFRFLGSEPLNVIGHHRDSQKAHPWPKPHLQVTWRFWWRSVKQCDQLAHDKETKKGEERNLQWQTRCSRRPLTLRQRYVVLHAGWSLGGSSKFQVSSKSVERLSRCGEVEICHFLYLRPVAYITACTIPYKPWCDVVVLFYGVWLAINRSQVQLPAYPLLRNWASCVVHTHVPLSPSSVICYWLKGGNMLCSWEVWCQGRIQKYGLGGAWRGGVSSPPLPFPSLLSPPLRSRPP